MEPLLLNKCVIKRLVRQTFSLFFVAIDSEKCLGYAICLAWKICQACCL